MKKEIEETLFEYFALSLGRCVPLQGKVGAFNKIVVNALDALV